MTYDEAHQRIKLYDTWIANWTEARDALSGEKAEELQRDIDDLRRWRNQLEFHHHRLKYKSRRRAAATKRG